MKPNAQVIDCLQTALSMELTAVHQYQLHAIVADDWGLDRLAAKMREEMTEEMGHADAYAQRIIFLKGDPEMALAKTPHRAKSLKDMFEVDLADEQEAIRFYTEAAETAGKAGDIGTRRIFEQTVIDEEGHMAWLETQLDLLERMGEAGFLALQMSPQGGSTPAA
jgi:bacterioferritin